MSLPRTIEAKFFELLNGLLAEPIRKGWGAPRLVPTGLIMLETTGRRSGRSRRVPLVATRIDGHLLVATFRGDRSHWLLNAAADPDVRYWLGGRVRRARATVIGGACSLAELGSLPPLLRWLGSALVPYTYAGWRFAVLAPSTGHGRRHHRARAGGKARGAPSRAHRGTRGGA